MASVETSNSVKCALCQAGGKLQVSHIIPSFVGNWLKESSATGFLRGAKNLNVRLQDTMKMPLLCLDCEKRFSIFENYFARQIFYPYQNLGIKKFSYNELLLKFIISIGWRVLYIQLNLQKALDHAPNLVPYANRALKTWRDYLLDLRKDEGDYEHHIFFLDFVETNTAEILNGFQWYTLRAIDGCLALGKETVFAYTKFPGIILVSAVYPPKLEGWIGTRIRRSSGEIAPPQGIEYPGFHEFLMDRVERLFDSGISSIQEEKVVEAMKSNAERLLFSKSFQVWIAERRRKREEKKRSLPSALVELIDIVENGRIDPSLPERDKNLQEFQMDLIAGRLADLDLISAQNLERGITDNISAARDSREEKLTVSDLGDIVILFLTLIGSTKIERLKRIDKMFKEIESGELYSKAQMILMFTWDPTDQVDRSFDWGCKLR